jgi:hypothetical protein
VLRPKAHSHYLRVEAQAVAGQHPLLHFCNQRIDVSGAGLANIDNEIGVYWRYLSITDLQPFQA